ncbi:MAG: homoserine dehydrogenase [Chitinophagales bacterium]|nr:homoserine dehydrogenase [Chitinophagales bacterium]
MSIQQKQLNIGLFGFGVVGEGLYKVLNQTSSLNASIKKVCIKHPEKKRDAPAELFTVYPEILLSDSSINVIVELIDDAEAAFEITKKALKAGKAIVSANKKMIAEHLPELLQLQKEYNTPLLYEAACCASIPVIRNLEEYYDNDLLAGISGIVNGSTNYILTKVFEDNLSYHDALLDAQCEGFAESNPTLDVEGIDAVNKLAIILAHTYGIVARPSHIVHTGIQNINEHDAVYAREKGYEIKLVAQARKLNDGKVAAFVLPQFVRPANLLHRVKNEYNGVVIVSGLAEEQFFYGKGAGSFPTASAVLSDISALRYDYKYEYKKLNRDNTPVLTDEYYLRVYASFDGLFNVPHHRFERIEEWASNEKRCSVTGIISCTQLAESNWWKQKGVSLILLPDAFADKLPEKKREEEEVLFV